MPLDFVDTAAQIEGMADELRSRREVREHRLRNALEVMRDFPLDAYEERRLRGDFGWDAPEVKEPPSAVHGLPEAPVRPHRRRRRRVAHRRGPAPGGAVLPDQHGLGGVDVRLAAKRGAGGPREALR